MQDTSSSQKSIAASGSIVFHALFALLLIFIMRDCNGGGGGDGTQYIGLELANLGDYDRGGGQTDDAAAQPEQSEPEQAEEQPVETQEEAPVSTSNNNTSTSNTNSPKPNSDSKPTENNTKPKKPNPFDHWEDGDKNGDGPDENNGEDKGDKTGDISGKGVFGGGGSGMEGGWSLAGRGMVVKPSLSKKPEREGRVVVDITVDKSGKVIGATVNVAQSNTSDATLHSLAIEAAKSARFNADQNAGGNKRGTITINFKLK